MWTRLFTAVVLAMSCVVYATSAQQADSPVPKMPKGQHRVGYQHPQSPPGLLRAGTTGVVTAEFSVDAKGRMKDLTLVSSGSDKFKELVKKDLADLTFDVPADWVEVGGEAARYVVPYVFEIDRTGAGCGTSPEVREMERRVLICASLMPVRRRDL